MPGRATKEREITERILLDRSEWEGQREQSVSGLLRHADGWRRMESGDSFEGGQCFLQEEIPSKRNE